MEKVLQGFGVSFGTARGKVKIIRLPSDYATFQEGQILVTEMTNPTMVPIMAKAAGIICEIGGLTSHPSIVSREMGIPCVVRATKAMQILKDGQEVHINGENGEIHLLVTQKDWINDHNESVLNTLGQMDLGTLQPFDWFQFHPLFAKKWLEKIETMIDLATEQKISNKEMAAQLPGADVIRDNIYFNMLDVKSAQLSKEKRMKITEFFNKLTMERFVKDYYSLEGTAIAYSEQQIEELIKKMPWATGDPSMAKLLGKLYSATYNFVNGLYLDFYTDYGVEYYGPYDVSKQFGNGAILVIKYFPDLKPALLWPTTKNSPAKQIKIFSIYQNVSFRTDWAACHGVFQGDTIKNLKKWALEVDGKFLQKSKQIEETTQKISELAVKQWETLTSQDFETIKQTGVNIRCYTLKTLFDRVGLDWKPEPKMVAAVRRKPFATKEYWGIPEDKSKVREFWKKMLDPRTDFFPFGSKATFS